MLWGSRAAYAAAVALSASTLLSASAFSQDEAGQRVELDEISIFATLNPIATFDYPGQVDVVDRDQIQTEQASTVAETLKNVPGVFVNGGARMSGQTPNIRGFDGEDVLILVDGVPQTFQSGHDGRLFVDPDLLKRVEVVKGPNSSLYGSGALGGVIAMTTIDASDLLEAGETAGARVKVGFQTADGQPILTTTGFARTEDGKFETIGSFTYRRMGSIELGNGDDLSNKDNIKSALAKGTAQVTPDLKATATWVHFGDDGVTPANPQDNGEVSSSNLLVKRGILSDTLSGKLSYAPEGSQWFNGNFLAYWAQNKVTENYYNSTRYQSRDVETIGVKADNRSWFELNDWQTKVTFTYGVDYHRDKQAGADSLPVGWQYGNNISSIPSAEADYTGTFVQAEIKMLRPASLPGELTLTPSARFDSFSMEASGEEDFSDEAFSPKIAAAYKPVPWFLLFGNYGSAFRAPDYNELYAMGNHFCMGPVCNTFIPNPDLKPQTAETGEVGAGFEFTDVVAKGDAVKLKGSYWHMDAHDYINQEIVGAGVGGASDMGCFTGRGGCYTRFFNTDHAILSGAEIALAYDSARFFGSASWATMTGRDADTDAYVGALQPDKVILTAGVKLPEYWTRLGTRFTFADKFTRADAATAYRDAYNLVDLFAVIEPTEGPLKGLRVDLGIDNVTDKAYQLIAADVYEKGINFKGAVSWTVKW
ncbi:TonB-dependent hemoglobin/transferrin/lactoferrin family receptor [Rhodomicrobium sp.]|uniref:TonB-dependent hemoglobin/transferrin/lactoferrin family receptor n=1 Tax=Rhodomicrobium sp. TaxID=2720632 RepID=UPI0039E6D118